MDGAIVVDDARVSRRMLSLLLTSLGERVVGEAATLQEAVAASVRCDPRVLFVDVGLLENRPEEALGRLRGVAPSAAVVACASLEQRTALGRALAAGVQAGVMRPFRRSQIADVLARLR